MVYRVHLPLVPRWQDYQHRCRRHGRQTGQCQFHTLIRRHIQLIRDIQVDGQPAGHQVSGVGGERDPGHDWVGVGDDLPCAHGSLATDSDHQQVRHGLQHEVRTQGGQWRQMVHGQRGPHGPQGCHWLLALDLHARLDREVDCLPRD